MIAIILVALMFQFVAGFIEENALRNTPHVGVIDIQGTIADAQEGSADNLAKALSKAYENKQLKATIQQQQEQVRQLKDGKMVQQIATGLKANLRDDSTVELKKKIGLMIREIDQCIATINT